MQPFVLALDIGSLFAVAFLLISFIGWIMNLINAQNPPPQPNRPVRRPAPRDGKVQSDIEEFLQQAMGRRAPQQPKGENAGIEIIEPAPAQRRSPARRPPPGRAAAPAAGTPTAAPPAPSAGRPGEAIVSRQSVGSSDLGAGVVSHLQDHMSSRVGQQVEAHLPRSVEQSISQHLGQFRAGETDTRRDVTPTIRSNAAVKDPTGLIDDLRSPDGMRKAVILHEILAKPRSLRKLG
ncbi:MAG: hypothetical protein AB7U20_01370 [Planctomycetaceae bacterium]